MSACVHTHTHPCKESTETHLGDFISHPSHYSYFPPTVHLQHLSQSTFLFLFLHLQLSLPFSYLFSFSSNSHLTFSVSPLAALFFSFSPIYPVWCGYSTGLGSGRCRFGSPLCMTACWVTLDQSQYFQPTLSHRVVVRIK